MQGLTGFYIIAREGVLLFSHEIFIQGSEAWDLALFSATMSAMQSFATELGHELVETIEIGDVKLYSSLDDIYGLIFVVKGDLESDEVEIFDILDKIKLSFFKRYDKFLKLEFYARINEGRLDIMVFNNFEKDLRKIIRKKSSIQAFLESL